MNFSLVPCPCLEGIKTRQPTWEEVLSQTWERYQCGINSPCDITISRFFIFLFFSFLFSDMGTKQIRKMTDFSRCRKNPESLHNTMMWLNWSPVPSSLSHPTGKIDRGTEPCQRFPQQHPGTSPEDEQVWRVYWSSSCSQLRSGYSLLSATGPQGRHFHTLISDYPLDEN